VRKVKLFACGIAIAACGRRALFALFVFAAGCGRLDFGEWSRSDASDDSSDAAPRANRAFVARDRVPANLGGLTGADATCAAAAAAAGLDGMFIAVLSTSTTNAGDRLNGSRGWVRVDGTPIVDTADAMFHPMLQPYPTGELNPIAFDEYGHAIPSPLDVWTGTTSSGTYDVAFAACGDWTTNASQTVTVGEADYSADTFDGAPYNCSLTARLYCFEVGKSVTVSPVSIDGRIAFLSTAAGLGGGLGALDALCQSDAMAANLPGTYLAAAATTTTTISSRFTIDARPWRRVDGTYVADGSAMFTSGPI
jgi:hypothetical protein